MRRSTVILSVVVVVLLGILALRTQPVTVAQDATPAGQEMEGLTFEPMGFAQGVPLPPSADLTAARAGFEPGAGFPFAASDPEGAFVVVESGAITARVEENSWTITRGGGRARRSRPGRKPRSRRVIRRTFLATSAGRCATTGRSARRLSSSS